MCLNKVLNSLSKYIGNSRKSGKTEIFYSTQTLFSMVMIIKFHQLLSIISHKTANWQWETIKQHCHRNNYSNQSKTVTKIASKTLLLESKFSVYINHTTEVTRWFWFYKKSFNLLITASHVGK